VIVGQADHVSHRELGVKLFSQNLCIWHSEPERNGGADVAEDRVLNLALKLREILLG
jgi:hypothetical protein